VAVGHTQDDHIETILMHLIRGSGTGGLRGLQPVNQWQLGGNRITVVRPLLTVSREETAAYCQSYQLAPRLDTTNLSMSPLRNKIRLQLLPLLKEYNPAIAEALQRTAKIAEDETAFIELLGDIAWERIVKIKNNTVLTDKESFTGAHPAVQRYLIRKAIEQLVGNLKDIEAHHIEDILAALHKPAGKTIQLPYGLVFVVEYDRYLLGTDPTALSPFPPLKGEFTLNVPGTTQIADWMVKTDLIRREEMKQGKDFTAYFDFDKTGDKLTVRPYRTGDRFQPLGMSGSKKLGEFMIDAHIPHAWRNRIPIVCSQAQIMWVVGYRIDDRFKVTEVTERVVRVEFKKRPNRSKPL
jgi:tRNA(Ile)-lysidine synthase